MDNVYADGRLFFESCSTVQDRVPVTECCHGYSVNKQTFSLLGNYMVLELF